MEIKRWTDEERICSGKHATLRDCVEAAVRSGLILNEADLRKANLTEANLCEANLRGANLSRANLREANLCEANLCGAVLRYADLRGANIDFASWPLWCGTRDVMVDRRIAAQLAAHFCTLECHDPDILEAQKGLMRIALSSHIGSRLGLGEDSD